MKVDPIVIELPQPPDFSDLLDDDIKAMFEGKGGYFYHDKLLAQLIKELQLMRGRIRP